MGARRRTVAVVAAAVLVAVAAVWVVTRAAGGTRSAHLVSTEQYLPGVEADLYLPAPTGTGGAAGVVPVVVLVPGGAWHTADRAGLAPLAEVLAGRGVAVVSTTYRVADDGVRFPVPVQDVRCATAYAAAAVRGAGLTPGPVVLVGHSSGAQVAALVALAGDHFGGTCGYPPVAVDGFVGLAGAYDLRSLAELAQPLLGASPVARPDLWREADPATWAGARVKGPALAVLLVHGDADQMVPPLTTTAFATALDRAGQPATVVSVPGATHDSVYQPDVVADRLAAWVTALAGAGAAR